MLPLTEDQMQAVLNRLNIKSLTAATIRQIVAVGAMCEQESQTPYLHLEVGNPGLPSNRVGVEAECSALTNGIAATYPPIMGMTELKNAGSQFVKAFLDVDVAPRCIVPTVGSMQGSFTMILMLGQRDPAKDTMLYLNPGFPPQHAQARMLGIKEESFDIYDYRGKKMEEKLEEILSKGNITGILYSNPNNPSWANLTEEELEIIGRLATKYDAIVLEDLAYMGMDFRTDISTPCCEPFVPSVAKYTDNYVLLLSASKIFSYAGQRIALVCMSNKLYDRHFPALEALYNMPCYGDAYIFGVIYAVSSGVSHSAQHAMAAMLKAAAEGRLNFVEDCRDYERRSKIARKIFTDAGFHIVYDRDGDRPVSDGFFFTAGYRNMDSETLQRALMRHGVATISLPGTGSHQHGLRICVSKLASDADFAELKNRLKAFTDEQQ